MLSGVTGFMDYQVQKGHKRKEAEAGEHQVKTPAHHEENYEEMLEIDLIEMEVGTA